ncbi:MAG TPA: hypothetical protein VFS43_14435 [Polyangiaceae bacterium]|nr:hypothetical protein [Polyangiaceae bacterium]
MKLHPEEVDLAELAQTLRGTFANEPPEGYLEGRTALRDAVLDRLSCSELEAEEVVDTMISQGFLRFTGNARGAFEGGVWRIDASAL